MKDKRMKNSFNHMSNQELTFTKEDRDEVFKQLHSDEQIQTKSLGSISKRFAPMTVSLLAIGLCLFFFMPSILQERGNGISNEINETNSIGVASQKDENFTTLFTVKDENNRIPLNLLLTYSKENNVMKVVSIPRDTYVPILDNDGTTIYDKLTHAYAYGVGGAENVRTTVSDLFDVTIDFYAVIDLETFSTMIDSMNGIEYELQEDIQVRAISQSVFELKNGTHYLNGEEVVALIMDATYERSMDEEDIVNLISAVMNKTKNEIPQTQVKELTTKVEGNITFDQLLENEMELPSIQSVSLSDGKIDTMIDETYFIKFEKDFLNSVREKLNTFD